MSQLWQTFYTENREPYYHNAETGETVWEIPVSDMPLPEVPMSQAPQYISINGTPFTQAELWAEIKRIREKYVYREVTGTDAEFISFIAQYHPEAQEKLENLQYFTVKTSGYYDGDKPNLCFWVVKTDGSSIDISIRKGALALVHMFEQAQKSYLEQADNTG